MKKILGIIVIATVMTACEGAGDRTHEMPTITQEPPSSNPTSSENTGPFDTSAKGTQDTSTTTPDTKRAYGQ